MSLFWCPLKVTKHYKNRGFSGHRGKPKMAPFGCKSAILGFPSKRGFYYLWCLKAVFRWEHYFYSVFSKTQLCRHERMYLDKKQKFTKNSGCLPKCKKVFFWYVFFCFLVVLFFCCLCFCSCVLYKGLKRLFSCSFRGFLSILFPQKACLKVFHFFLFCFFLLLSFFSKIHFLYFFFVHQPLFNKRLFVGFLLFFFCLSFPFLSFAFLFDTNFPNIPFLEIQFAFVFGCFFFLLLLLLLLFLFFILYVSAFLFFVVMLALFLVFLFCFVLCFCFYYSFLFCFQSLEKKAVFPAILVFFLSSVG